MNTRIIAFAGGALLAASGAARAESIGVASTALIGPMCVKSTVSGTTYAWSTGNSSMTTVFQSSADNNRQITVDTASDQGVTYYPNFIVCNEGDKSYPTPFTAH